MNKNNFNEEDLKSALKDALIEFNHEYLSKRTDEDRLVVNQVLLKMYDKILKNFGVDYKK